VGDGEAGLGVVAKEAEALDVELPLYIFFISSGEGSVHCSPF